MDKNVLSGLDDVDVAQILIAELLDGLRERVARLHRSGPEFLDGTLDGILLQ